MTKTSNRVKTPFVRISKRGYASVTRHILVRAVAVILAALIAGLFIKTLTGLPLGRIYRELVVGNFSNSIRTTSFFKEMAILLLIAIGLAPAFKMHFWNIGAQGQVLIGGMMSAICLYYIRASIPSAALSVLALLSAILFAGLWAAIPAIFKVKFEANETLFTLMMNYVALQIVSCFTDKWKGAKSSFGVMDRFTGTKNGYLSSLFGLDVGWTILISVLLTVAMYIYLTKTTHGYEISVVGESLRTARYAGINDKKVIIRTAFISGAICGIAGFLYVTNLSHSISRATGGSYGFTAITVAWLGAFNPIFMTLIAGLIAFLTGGGTNICNIAGLNEATNDVIICIFLFFILGSEFFVRYRLIFNEKTQRMLNAIAVLFVALRNKILPKKEATVCSLH